MEENNRFCRLCEIFREIPGDITEYADRLYRLLDEDERAEEALIRQRIQVCEKCEKHVEGTCLACGCYCIVRAAGKRQRCPKKKW